MLYGMKTLREILKDRFAPGDSGDSLGAEIRGSGSKNASILFAVHAGIVGKSKRSGVGIAGVIEVDSIVSEDVLHRFFEWNGLRVEIARGVGAAGQRPDHFGYCILGV